MKKKVLFVDDQNDLLEVYRGLCNKAGYQTYTEADPSKVLHTIEKEHIQVMFFDLRMPRINGIELCHKVRENNKIALIYAITGYSSLFQLSECREAGFDDYFTKPIDVQLLTTILEQSFQKLARWSKK